MHLLYKFKQVCFLNYLIVMQLPCTRSKLIDYFRTYYEF